MRNSYILIAIIACLIASTIAVNIRKEQHALKGKPSKSEKGPDSNIHLITLKKIVQSSSERKEAIQLLSTAQYYSYDQSEYSSDKDFIYTQTEKSQSYSTSTSTHTIKLFNFKNVQYTGDISIGSRDNKFTVLYDTGSANIWMNSAHCNDEGCTNHKQYNSAQSRTYKNVGLSLDVQFGTGELIGEMAQETFFFGDIEVQNQDFVEIHEERGAVFAQSHFDGIIGLAFPSMAAYNKNPLFDNLMDQKRITNNIFAFYMSPRDGKTDSEISVGGPNEVRYRGEITYHKVLKDYYWLIAADNILIDGKDVGLCKGGCYVIADTGTSLITGPSESIFALLDHISVNSRCKNVSKLPDISFILDGTTYTLTGEEYVLQEKADGTQSTVESAKNNVEMSTEDVTCIASFMPLDIPNDEENFEYEKAWILGDTFLQKYYSIYDRDNGTVGFALANHN